MREYIVRETDCGLATRQETVGELVRCKDCVHYYKGWGEELCHRGWTPKDVSAEWFCPKGERKDDE